ncbi:hypothetical protein COHA_005186 [Chlorella ohadii]|uniref:Uncharacterized protein n=1 Tax=Chlorella ohadii TaxID=2649997 RepID=A0AAD5H6M0_9CHLO|nr:hypothetical protein COHA_005186 [Chlorella ohadii]
MNRGRIADHIDLLNALDALSSGGQPTSARKSPTAAGGGVKPASQPASLAASLAYWRKTVPPMIGGGSLSWQAIPNAGVAAAIHTDAVRLARYYSQPSTVKLLKANPSVVPPLLKGPEGMTRGEACKQVLKMQLPGKVKYQLCDPTHPYVSAESLSTLEMDSFMDAQSAVAGKQMADWHKGIRPPSKLPGAGGRTRGPVSGNRPFVRGPRRSMQFTCSGFDNFLQILLGDGRDYFCESLDCEFQASCRPDDGRLVLHAGQRLLCVMVHPAGVGQYHSLCGKLRTVSRPRTWGQGCLGVLKMAADTVWYCLDNGCNPLNLADERIIANMAVSFATQFKFDVHFGLCIGIEGLEKILKKLGMSVCATATLTIYPYASQFQGTVGAGLLFAGFEIGGRIQLDDGAGNPMCAFTKQYYPSAYNRVLKCVDFCQWKPGNGAFEFGAWLNLLFFRKTWSIPIVQTPVPKCDK